LRPLSMHDDNLAMSDRSCDEPEGVRSRTAIARNRASALSFFLLVISIILAAISMLDGIAQQWSDVLKVAAVAFFVSAMVSLAMGMIGDAYDHQK